MIQSELASTELTHSLDTIHVGYLDGKASAFVFAQVEPRTGWSRLTYMGLVPERRGKGLGLWVHRHGMTMMRAQGGQWYHGSTTATNQAMLKTFRANGCKEYRTVQEWIWARN